MSAQYITKKDLDQFKKEFLVELNKLISKKEAPVKWLKSHQVQRLLAISPSTLLVLRLNGVIPYSKLGGNIFYSSHDINAVMQKHKIIKK